MNRLWRNVDPEYISKVTSNPTPYSILRDVTRWLSYDDAKILLVYVSSMTSIEREFVNIEHPNKSIFFRSVDNSFKPCWGYL